MKKSDVKKYDNILKREAAVQKLGGFITVIPLLLLLLAVVLAQSAGSGVGMFEGKKLAAFLIIAGVALFEILFWLYFLYIHGRVRAIVMRREWEFLTERELPFTWKEENVLLFRHKSGKSFSLVLQDGKKNETFKMNFDELYCLYDGDTTFYSCFAIVFSQYIKERGLRVDSLKIKGDFPGKRVGVKEYHLIDKGALTAQAEKLASKRKKIQ